MKKPSLEFSRVLPVDRVPAGGSIEKIEADAEECLAMARRLGVERFHHLAAELRASPWRGGGLKLAGSLTADLEQVSVVSLEPFRHSVNYPVERYFLPPGVDAGDEDDADPIISGEVDMGEVVAETLALELDPYPRKPGEEFGQHVESEEQPAAKQSPFAALSKLKRR
jgi:uncharacterized metal-binding protein YceD (DUF177 family)